MNWSIPWSVGGHLFPAVFAMLGVKLAMMIHGRFAPEGSAIPVGYGAGGGIVGLFVCSMVINKRVRLPRVELFRLLSALVLATLVGLAALVGFWVGEALFGPSGLYLGLVFQFVAGLIFAAVLGIRANRRSRRRLAEKAAAPLTTNALILRQQNGCEGESRPSASPRWWYANLPFRSVTNEIGKHGS